MRPRTVFGYATLIATIAVSGTSAFAQWTPKRIESDGSDVARTPWGRPDFQGLWNNSTTTPLVRLTSEEQAQSRRAQRAVIEATGGTGAGWLEQGGRIERESLVGYPTVGRMRMTER